LAICLGTCGAKFANVFDNPLKSYAQLIRILRPSLFGFFPEATHDLAQSYALAGMNVYFEVAGEDASSRKRLNNT
jgi:hypothetical protein